MPRPVHAQGRPGTRVIPDDWAITHAPATAQTRTTGCSIRHPGGTPGPIDPDTGRKTITPLDPHYVGTCRVQQLAIAEATPDVGEETIPTGTYLVTLALGDAPDLHTDDLVLLEDPGPNGDPAMAGVSLIVGSYSLNTQAWERVLHCTVNQS